MDKLQEIVEATRRELGEQKDLICIDPKRLATCINMEAGIRAVVGKRWAGAEAFRDAPRPDYDAMLNRIASMYCAAGLADLMRDRLDDAADSIVRELQHQGDRI